MCKQTESAVSLGKDKPFDGVITLILQSQTGLTGVTERRLKGPRASEGGSGRARLVLTQSSSVQLRSQGDEEEADTPAPAAVTALLLSHQGSAESPASVRLLFSNTSHSWIKPFSLDRAAVFSSPLRMGVVLRL